MFRYVIRFEIHHVFNEKRANCRLKGESDIFVSRYYDSFVTSK